MSKKYKRKRCVYCGGMAEGPDHVFARKFFLRDKRESLPKVPACKACNGEKSELEHYLASLLPFGGRHADARKNLVEMVPKRLTKNRSLHGILVAGQRQAWTLDLSGLYLKTFTLPIDGDRLTSLFRFVTRGLLAHHFNVILNHEHFVMASALTPKGEEYFEHQIRKGAAQRIAADLGEGTFRYVGAQGTDYPEVSIWLFSIYNGVKLGGGAGEGSGISMTIGSITGNRRVLKNARRLMEGKNSS